jgi:hypothetical protein
MSTMNDRALPARAWENSTPSPTKGPPRSPTSSRFNPELTGKENLFQATRTDPGLCNYWPPSAGNKVANLVATSHQQKCVFGKLERCAEDARLCTTLIDFTRDRSNLGFKKHAGSRR